MIYNHGVKLEYWEDDDGQYNHGMRLYDKRKDKTWTDTSDKYHWVQGVVQKVGGSTLGDGNIAEGLYIDWRY